MWIPEVIAKTAQRSTISALALLLEHKRATPTKSTPKYSKTKAEANEAKGKGKSPQRTPPPAAAAAVK